MERSYPEFSIYYLVLNSIEFLIYLVYAIQTISLAKKILKPMNYILIFSFLVVECLRLISTALFYFHLLEDVRCSETFEDTTVYSVIWASRYIVESLTTIGSQFIFYFFIFQVINLGDVIYFEKIMHLYHNLDAFENQEEKAEIEYSY